MTTPAGRPDGPGGSEGAGSDAETVRAQGMGRLDRRAARHQLLAWLACNTGSATRARPVQPVLPAAGRGGESRFDHYEGNRDPGHVHRRAAVWHVEADDEVQDRDPDVRRYQRSLSAPAAQGRRRERRPLQTGAPVVGEPARRLRADDPARRAARLESRGGRATCRTSSGSSAGQKVVAISRRPIA